MLVWIIWALGLTISTFLGAYIVKRRRELGYPLLTAIYVSYILAANILASRIMLVDLGFTTLALAGGTIIFPFCAQIIDMINEIYGWRKTYTAILTAFFTNILLVSFIYISALEPPAPWLTGMEEAWRFFFLQAPRIVIASFIAFITVELIDAKVFASLKLYFARRFKENPYSSLKSITAFVTCRSLSSDVVNMVLDSLIFFPLAFAFVVPNEVLLSFILAGTLAKCILTIVDTPWFIIYRLLTRHVERDF
ncbi:MAG: queuosine precursor transporter [Candidatus Bathyarchaeota archaeon]